MRIGRSKIEQNGRAFIIAELSANHKQSFNIAMKTIKAAHVAGADAVKLQTYTADTITLKSDRKEFKIKQGTIWDGRTLYDLYKEAYTPWEWQPKLIKYALSLGMECFSSAFDKTSVDFLENLNISAYKIASFEITDIPLIRYIASKGKPVIISTGIAELEDIVLAVNACKSAGNCNISLLKCTSDYPARYEDMNLATIPDMIKRFKVVVGVSDHTMGLAVPCAATVLGSRIIEKHIILKRKLGGPDARFSLEPEEFKQMVQVVRETEKAIGKVNYKICGNAKKNRAFARSLFVVSDIKNGGIFTENNIRSIRPGNGMAPVKYNSILGKKAARNLVSGTPLKAGMIKGLK